MSIYNILNNKKLTDQEKITKIAEYTNVIHYNIDDIVINTINADYVLDTIGLDKIEDNYKIAEEVIFKLENYLDCSEEIADSIYHTYKQLN